MLKKLPFCVLLALVSLRSGAEIRFSGLDLAADPDPRLLFMAVSSRNYSAGGANRAEERGQLFVASTEDRSVNRLSACPEKMAVLDGGKTLLVQSVYGVQTLPASGGLPRAIPGFPSFTGSYAAPGQAESIAPSPDGMWVLFVEPSSYGRGDLVLVNSVTGARQFVAASVERPGRAFPASWSADSRFFLYARSGKLYYYAVNTAAPPPDTESYRFVGGGGVNSVYWTEDGFFYLKGSALYKIRGGDMFLKTPYSRFLDAGTLAGKIPFEFDPNFDSFWVAPDASAMIFSKSGRNIFYYPLNGDGILPYIMVPRSGSLVTVLWSAAAITVICRDKGESATAWRYTPRNGNESSGFRRLAVPEAQAALSPGGDRAVIWGKSGAVVYDYQNWLPLRTLTANPVRSCVWTAKDELVIGGEELIERISLGAYSDSLPQTELLCLASVGEYGFEQNGYRIMAKSGGKWFVTNGILPWTEFDGSPPLKEASQTSPYYSVSLEERRSGIFANMPVMRRGTPVYNPGAVSRTVPETAAFAFFPFPDAIPKNAAERQEHRFPVFETDGVLSHGSRDSRKVALCFDLYDDDTGLYPVLDALARYGVRATFFLNGEFIRRYPAETAEIAASGHESASMFHVPVDFFDSRYRIDRDFIVQGLARNEEDYYNAAGRELPRIWHPPWYALSPEIAAYAAAAGYRTVARDIDPGDWIQSAAARQAGIEQPAAADMIDNIVDALRGGSIVPIRLGLLPGGRNDYLFHSLELLLDAIVRAGYEITPVSEL
jgi:peptidoglycan/xylan/chitin deacetylase (PgdA/CDA1 family)